MRGGDNISMCETAVLWSVERIILDNSGGAAVRLLGERLNYIVTPDRLYLC